MEKGKHTPGPWRIADKNEYRWELPEIGRFGEPTLTILSDANSHRGYGVLCVPYSITDGPHMGNARLIAAAPELLEALERAERRIVSEVYWELDRVYGSTHDDFGHELTKKLDADPDIQAVRAAIAKAKGEGA